MSGLYKIINDDNETFQVFCDFDSEPGFAWNLIQSFSLSNKDLMRVTYNSEIGSVWCSAVIYLSLPHFCLLCIFQQTQDRFFDCQPLTNRAGGPYWEILARDRDSTYKNDRGPCNISC